MAYRSRSLLSHRSAAQDNLRVVREQFADVVEPDDLRGVGRAPRAVADQLA
ncbi:hypothetical protein [Sciscionella marina]|uniref:hypothetical protein n=1 Tax=Sciscionella marina TaxID=508770 RepID=UPI000375DA11|nr:hypothetical protein [Sciscionella marina]